jgi:hypothetical protein
MVTKMGFTDMDASDLMRFMDIATIRRNNLRHLIDTEYGGVDARIAEKLDRQPGYISRLFTEKEEHRRNIGASLARDIERVSGKPEGWLDHPHFPTPASGNEDEALVQAIRSMTPEQKEKLKAVIILIGAQLPGVVLNNIEPFPTERSREGALVVTDPDEKDILLTYRSVSDEGRRMIKSTVRAAATDYSNKDADSQAK